MNPILHFSSQIHLKGGGDGGDVGGKLERQRSAPPSSSAGTLVGAESTRSCLFARTALSWCQLPGRGSGELGLHALCVWATTTEWRSYSPTQRLTPSCNFPLHGVSEPRVGLSDQQVLPNHEQRPVGSPLAMGSS